MKTKKCQYTKEHICCGNFYAVTINNKLRIYCDEAINMVNKNKLVVIIKKIAYYGEDTR